MTDKDLDNLAFRFFKMFAQFEWALKSMGHVYAHPKTGGALADWNAYSKAGGTHVLKLPQAEAQAAIEFLFSAPPKLQIYTDGKLDWKTVSGGTRSADTLFGHIKRIRNNLYHGGKFNGTWLEPERNGQLICHALAILEALLAQDDGLRQAISTNAS